ncbi:hypothetical protein RHGRI_025855 [Rhododendron griersonianum]|uniref:Uncharacterized protein n=1 Tax=Rhododendron griersonianum TaxID=479676 RepID=A0AAV6IQU3_9ERIC|nr:hypothetical protein RHGRI_025855 [Rhododendron griersonianum]
MKIIWYTTLDDELQLLQLGGEFRAGRASSKETAKLLSNVIFEIASLCSFNPPGFSDTEDRRKEQLPSSRICLGHDLKAQPVLHNAIVHLALRSARIIFTRLQNRHIYVQIILIHHGPLDGLM